MTVCMFEFLGFPCASDTLGVLLVRMQHFSWMTLCWHCCVTADHESEVEAFVEPVSVNLRARAVTNGFESLDMVDNWPQSGWCGCRSPRCTAIEQFGDARDQLTMVRGLNKFLFNEFLLPHGGAQNGDSLPLKSILDCPTLALKSQPDTTTLLAKCCGWLLFAPGTPLTNRQRKPSSLSEMATNAAYNLLVLRLLLERSCGPWELPIWCPQRNDGTAVGHGNW